jgi:hypothetical protein
MLELGKLTRTDYAAAVITSAYAACGPDEEEEAREIIDTLVDPPAEPFHTSASGATEIISKVQQSLEYAEEVASTLEAMGKDLAELSSGELSEQRSEEVVSEIERFVETLNEASSQEDAGGTLFVQIRGGDLLVSIGNGSTITISLPDYGVNLQGVDLTDAQDVAAFSEAVETGLVRIKADVASLKDQLDRLTSAAQIIEYASEDSASTSVTIFDDGAAAAMAGDVAAAVLEDLSALFGVEDGLDNTTAAAMLA